MNKLFTLLACLFLVGSVWAQNGTIRGKIMDGTFGEPMIGATVRLQSDASKGSTTDLDGNYTIGNLAAGTYNLNVSSVGFESRTIEGVVVTAGDVTVVPTLTLYEATEQLQEVVVTAEVIRDSESAMLTLQRKSSNVLDGISSEMFSRAGDSDVGSAIKRVTGVSVQGGKYVYVRGLGDRYSKTGLNGATIPGLDPNRNTVEMDLFPTNLIDNILVFKTFTPDLPADFVGGYVVVETKDFPETFTLKASASVGYNPQVHFTDDFLSFDGGSPTDWLGFDNGSRDIPDVLLNDIPEFTDVISDPSLGQDLLAASSVFDPQFSPNTTSKFLDQSYSISVGNQINIGSFPLGFIGSLTYKRDLDNYTMGERNLYRFTGILDDENLQFDYLLGDHNSNESVLWGGMFAAALKLNNTNKVSVTYLRNQSGTQQGRILEGPETVNGNNDLFNSSTIWWTERALQSVQLRGEHAFNGGQGIKVNWISSRANTSLDQPDLRFFAYGLNRDEQGNVSTSEIRAANLFPPSHYWRGMTQLTWDNKVDVEIPFQQWSGLDAKAKVGGGYTFSNRDFFERRYEFNTPLENAGNLTRCCGDDPNLYTDRDNILDDFDLSTLFSSEKVYIVDKSVVRNTYRGEQSVTSAYAMVELPIVERLKVVGGARMEITNMLVTNADSTAPLGILDNLDILPSLTGTFFLNDKMNLRFGAFRTLARPTFREKAEYASFEFFSGGPIIGNADLERTLITNIDLRWEYFPSPTELFSFSVFAKDFTNPIERIILPEFSNQTISFRNVEQAQVAGIEMEARKNMAFISPALENLSIGGNVSLVYSVTAEDPDVLAAIRQVVPDWPETRVMFGQSPYIINAYVGYNDFDKWESNLSFNIQGPRLIAVSQGGTPNIFEQPRADLNFNLTRQLSENLEAKFQVSNILNARYWANYPYQGNDEFVFYSYRAGTDFSVKLSYNIQ
ncbi:MAG TPA: hypothetical protein DCE41_03185 [Cytophagales bacterium]|nr:hypothetical protein [Cytophagales bacterium]HAA23431.1 hypothetical protein [Cytophagales bacterium]HAP58626.1 hypothetical protein [Cytophagales bacterium]